MCNLVMFSTFTELCGHHQDPMGFPCGSISKESTCNAGDPSSTPGSGRSIGERDRLPTPVFLGFPGSSDGKASACNAGDLDLTWIWSLGREDPLEESMATHSSILAWRIPWTIPWGRKELEVTEWLSLSPQSYLKTFFINPKKKSRIY